MLLLNRVEIVNFACFEHVDLELATGNDRCLTVVCAENGSGKTTFLRALRWVFYGDRGLPGDDPTVFSVHPAWWDPSQGQVETKISITFETDGGTRYHEEGGPRRTFRLTRSVVTVSRDAVRDDQPDFRRINPSLTLLQRSDEGGWAPFSDDPNVIDRTVDLLLPWGLRDFFFMDADEATDFVGGRENRPLPKKRVIEKTTSAINNLLGLQTFQHAISRVSDLQKDLQREISRASGDTSLREMQEDLDSKRDIIEKSEIKLDDKQNSLSDLKDRREQTYGALQQALKDTGAHEQLEQRLTETDKARKKAMEDRKKTLDQLSTSLEDEDLLAGLMVGKLNQVYEELEPLHQKGLIPLTHISFVRERLNQENCICGESLAEGTPHRENVKQLLSESVEQEYHSNLLGQLYDVTGEFIRELCSDTRDWADRIDELRVELGDLDAWISELDSRKEELDRKVNAIDREHVQTLKGELDALDGQIERLDVEITGIEVRLKPLKDEAASLDKQIAQRQKREKTAQDKRAASDLAAHIQNALANAYGRIQNEQVLELSSRMDRLFAQMAANVPDEDFGHEEEEKATVRMIAEVGVRHVQGTDDKFEIYAKNHRGRILPPVEINGASRRVLALSFILALCIESNTDAPLVADSLLNMMSGRVRTNTFKMTVKTSRQPILLLTRADLSERPEVAIVQEYAGSTYTLTGQWDVMGLGHGGDVVNQTVDRHIAVACGCGPGQFCDVCMRQGDEQRSKWERRAAEIQGVLA